MSNRACPGSTVRSTVVSFSNTVFSSTVTRDASIVAPAASRALLGLLRRGQGWTNFAPKGRVRRDRHIHV